VSSFAPRNLIGKGPRVALLVSHLSDEYEWSIGQGVRAATEARGGTVVCFAGGALADPNPERRLRNLAFDLVEPKQFDAILCLSSVVGQFLPPSGMAEWLSRFSIPVASVGLVAGITSLVVDDGDGIRQLLEHLVDHHGYRRIGFVAGPESNLEAQARRAAYVAFLEERGLPYDPRFVVEGGFTREGGEQATRVLLDARQVSISELDAIIACNDYMAFGVIDELARRRITVPGQIAVVGFDDMALARNYHPPLTTVRQPLAELGREAAETVLSWDGGPPGQVRGVPTEIVLRRSCGCAPTDVPDAPAGFEVKAESSTSNDTARWHSELVLGLIAEATGEEAAFQRVLEPFLMRLALAGIDPTAAQDLLPVLRERAMPRLGDDRAAHARLVRALGHGRELSLEFSARSRQLRYESIGERTHRFARALELRMFGPNSELSTVLVEYLPGLDVEECLVAEHSGVLGEFRVAFGFNAHDAQSRIVTFRGAELAPPEFARLRGRSCFVLPLRYGSQSLGMAVLAASNQGGTFYETLAEVFGIVLKGVEMRRALETR
jgi:DNA-binding LacI/PurR family transcriptional regulator